MLENWVGGRLALRANGEFRMVSGERKKGPVPGECLGGEGVLNSF